AVGEEGFKKDSAEIIRAIYDRWPVDHSLHLVVYSLCQLANNDSLPIQKLLENLRDESMETLKKWKKRQLKLPDYRERILEKHEDDPVAIACSLVSELAPKSLYNDDKIRTISHYLYEIIELHNTNDVNA
ncbi:hypothetical protein PMAYCL1PPCAC_01727, partial [Pristionchus mayeri]